MYCTLRTSFIIATVLCSIAARGQSVEEFDRDDPPVERADGQNSAAPDLDEARQQIVRRTNRFREKHELAAVESNQQLHETAQYFADYMARTEKYGHTADGQRPSERAAAHGYEYCIVLENIAYRYSSAGFETTELAKGFVKGWKNSPGHRKNMLDPHVTQTGVAVAHSEQTGNYYGVQMFGRPESARITFRVSNGADDPVTYTLAPQERGEERTLDLPPRVTRMHERCRPITLQFAFSPSQSIAVENGAAYVVEQSESQLGGGRAEGPELSVRQEEFPAESPDVDR